MNFYRMHRRWPLRLGLLASGFFSLASALASSININAEFTPNRNDPGKVTFTNTTRLSGVCSGTHMQLCARNGWWSIDTALRGFKTGNGIRDYGRGSIFFSMPGPRQVRVTSEHGDQVDLTLRITGVAFRYSNPAATASPLGVLRGCSIGLNNANSGNGIMRLLLRNDQGYQGRSDCSFESLNAMEYSIGSLDFVYGLDTPDPLKMKNGTYRGSTTYTVGGQGHDLDLGDGVALGDSQVVANFTLTVNHTFALDFPPGIHRAVLQPAGGWSQWIDYAKVPDNLRKDVSFRVSGNAPFSVNLKCQYLLADGRCGISNGIGAPVPLDVAITLPGFTGSAGGASSEAMDYPLLQKGQDIPSFQSTGGPVFNRRSYLRFAVNGEPIKEMVKHPGTEYKGNVTIIFDADI